MFSPQLANVLKIFHIICISNIKTINPTCWNANVFSILTWGDDLIVLPMISPPHWTISRKIHSHNSSPLLIQDQQFFCQIEFLTPCHNNLPLCKTLRKSLDHKYLTQFKGEKILSNHNCASVQSASQCP